MQALALRGRPAGKLTPSWERTQPFLGKASWVFVVAAINTIIKNNLGNKRLTSYNSSSSEGKTVPETGTDGEQCSRLAQAGFQHSPGPPAQGWYTTYSGVCSPILLSSQDHVPQTSLQANIMEAIPQMRSLLPKCYRGLLQVDKSQT